MTTAATTPPDGPMQPDGSGTGAAPFATALLALAICVPAVLGVYPIRLALIGMRFGPAGWVAVSWQLASVVTWAILAIVLLQVIRRRTDANIAGGQPALTLLDDGPTLAPSIALAILVHAVTIATVSEIMVLGRGRPAFLPLVGDVLLLYPPMNLMTILGLIAAAIVAAEHRARLSHATLRDKLEQDLSDARANVLSALADLNGPATAVAPAGATTLLDRITVTIGNRTIVVPVADIDLIEASSYYAQLHVGSQRYLVRQSMNSLEQRLDAKRFARIHRSTIVNLDRVVELRPYDRRSYLVILRDGRRLMMSRRRRQLLEYLIP